MPVGDGVLLGAGVGVPAGAVDGEVDGVSVGVLPLGVVDGVPLVVRLAGEPEGLDDGFLPGVVAWLAGVPGFVAPPGLVAPLLSTHLAMPVLPAPLLQVKAVGTLSPTL